jgi:hypothetical protein
LSVTSKPRKFIFSICRIIVNSYYSDIYSFQRQNN